MPTRWTPPLLLSGIAIFGSGAALAQDVDPEHPAVAARWWGGQHVSIETWWGFTLTINPTDGDVPEDADLTLFTSRAPGGATERWDAPPFIVSGVDAENNPRSIDLTLDRRANESDPRLTPTGDARTQSPHPVRIRSIAAPARGETKRPLQMFLIETDGVRILHTGAPPAPAGLNRLQIDRIGDVDAVLIPFTCDQETARLTRQLSPRFVIPIGDRDAGNMNALVTKLHDAYELESAAGNTLALVSPLAGESDSERRIISLEPTPWNAPPRIAEGLNELSEAREEFIKSIKAMTIEQLDHRPSDGTHTVRWNAQHTAGSEMVLMSLAFRQTNPGLPLLRITPPQKPDDYEPPRPDWSLSEEIAHIRRVGDYTRRFSYSFDGVDPDDERYPSFFKSLDGLFSTLSRHYIGHKASVEAKTELPDWPGR